MYYLGRSLRSDNQDEPKTECSKKVVDVNQEDDYDRVYDRISHDSETAVDFMVTMDTRVLQSV